MEWTFELLESPEIISIVTSGKICSIEFGRMLDELVSLEYWRRGIPLFLDHRQLRITEADSMELMACADSFINKSPNFAFTPVAILYGCPNSIEIGELYGEITEDNSLSEVRRFLDETDAMQWLMMRSS